MSGDIISCSSPSLQALRAYFRRVEVTGQAQGYDSTLSYGSREKTTDAISGPEDDEPYV
tara:strand:- start:1059 stop:1235 length:177 start_codon:yes stop_codon:yes gene_type:complete